MNSHQFVVMWDCQGLEYVEDITAIQQNKVWAMLKGEVNTARVPNLFHLKLRAQHNMHRHYEIYLIEAVDGITADDIKQMFDASPQSAADTIRRLGTRFYSDRVDSDQVLIR